MIKRHTILAIEHDGLNSRIMCIHLDILSETPEFNIERAVIDACTEYVQTPEGRTLYEHNCGNFNWADFAANVPNNICQKHGFEKADNDVTDTEVDWDQHLVNNACLSYQTNKL